jgi:hypothetical protein
MKVQAVALALLTTGCATARLVGPQPFTAPDRAEPRVVVIEPFFETAEWQTIVKTEVMTVMGSNGPSIGTGGIGMGSPFAHDVAVQHQEAIKPMFAKVPSLVTEQRQVIAELQRLRPSWQIGSTSKLNGLSGPVTLVRVIITDWEMLESNRTLKNLAFGFGLLIWPLQLINITPVEETQRVYGTMHRFETDAQSLGGRLIRYPTQPDFAVNTSNLPAVEKRFGLDISYTEGLLANEAPRDPVLLTGFSARLAAAIVALVEEP